MEVDPHFWQDPGGLNAIYIRPASSPTPTTPAAPGSSQPASALIVGTTSSSPASSQLASAAIPIPTPSPGTLSDPNAFLLTSPAPTAAPALLSAVGSSPAPTPIATASSTSVVTILQASPSPITVATTASTPASLQLISTPTPFATPAIAITGSTPASNAIVSSSGADASSSPSPTLTPVVPLSAVASYQPTTAPIAVNHQGQFPSVTISFNLAGGMALGNAVTAIHQMQQRIGMPSAVHGSFSGTAEAFQASLAGEPFLILAALIAVYIVLGILYESYIHPITILSTLPSASVGALLALMLFHTELSVIAIIGLLLLIGIVKKNAILMVDFALEAERTENMRPREAIYQACLLRFRPILMTTTAALFGALPLIMSSGMGAELRRPLGIAIVGGLILSQVLTLYTTPVVYLYFDRLRDWWASRRAAIVPPQAAFGLSDAT